MRAGAVLACAALLSGCDGGDTTSGSGGSAGGGGADGCPPGELAQDDGSCRAAGLPPDLPCAPGEVVLDDGCAPAGVPEDRPCPPGEVAPACVPAGVPPDGCAEGFVHDGDRGCEPILPAGVCPEGMMAVPGDAACRAVAPCGNGTWGDIPVDGDSEYVDGSYLGGDSDGSSDKPWTTIQGGIDAALVDGAIVAIAAGSYVEDIFVKDRIVRLWGRCPELVSLSPTGAPFAVIDVQDGADGSELRDLAVTGGTRGIGVSGSGDVLIERVWVHDTFEAGIELEPSLGQASATIRGSLVERASLTAISVIGSSATIEGTATRDTTPLSAGGGWGLSLEQDAARQIAADVLVVGSLIERSREAGVVVTGADLIVEGSVVRDVSSGAEGLFGRGFALQPHPTTLALASLALHGSLIEDTQEMGIFAIGSELSLENTVVRRAQPDDFGNYGRGLGVQNDPLAGARGAALVRASLIEQHSEIGVVVVGSDLTLEGTAVRDIEVDPAGLFGWGIAAQYDTITGARASAVVRQSSVERASGYGIAVSGSDATVEDTRVSDTHTSITGQFGRGINVQATGGERASVSLDACLIDDNREAGIVVAGSDVSIAHSEVRGTLPDDAGNYGVGINLQIDPTSGEGASAVVVGTRVAGSHALGVFASGSALTLEQSAIVETDVRGLSSTGRGVSVQDEAGLRSTLAMTACAVEQNRQVGVMVVGSDATLEACAIRDTGAAAGHFGIGVGAQIALASGEAPEVALSWSVLEQNHEAGVVVIDGHAALEGVLVRDTAPSDAGEYGDGAVAQGATATVALRWSRLAANARAGLANFGANVVLEGSALGCNAFDLAGETWEQSAFAYVDLGGNACGCPERPDGCHVASASFQPPGAVGN